MQISQLILADAEPKGRMRLQDVNQIEPVVDAKNVFRIASPECEIQFQASSAVEMNEWLDILSVYLLIWSNFCV